MRLFLHRLAEWLSLGGSSGAHLVQNAFSSYPEVATQSHAQMLLQTLQGWRLQSLNPVLMLWHPWNKKCFLRFFLCFYVCPLLLTLSQSATEKSLDLFSLNLPFWYLYTLMRFLQAFSSPWWTVLILSAFPHDEYTGTLVPVTSTANLALPCAGEPGCLHDWIWKHFIVWKVKKIFS